MNAAKIGSEMQPKSEVISRQSWKRCAIRLNMVQCAKFLERNGYGENPIYEARMR